MSDNHSETIRRTTSAVLVDAHVHIHDCFDLAEFLDAAARNFSAAAAAQSLAAGYVSVLCLTETCRARKFEQLRSLAESCTDGGVVEGSTWRVYATAEPISISADHPEFGRIHIIAGKQIVVAERLEVLALGCAKSWADGLPASEVIDGVTSSGAVAVLPWGFGKWLGRRGRILRSLLEQHHSQCLFLGDNSGRPIFFAEPNEFELGRRLGLKVLPGTDPLPFASEARRAGSFGGLVDGLVSDLKPWTDLCRHLVQPDLTIQPFGRLETPLRFLRNQLAMQYVTRTSGGNS
jgi:hypothetical protein